VYTGETGHSIETRVKVHHQHICLSLPSWDVCREWTQHLPQPSCPTTQHQYSGQVDETHGLNHQGRDRDAAPSQQHK
jgi:hypothetical protein